MPSESPSYDATLQTLTELTADRERRRIAAALQRGDELYRVLLRTVPDLIVALFDRDLRCQVDRRRHGRDRACGARCSRARRSWKRSATTPTPSAWTRCCGRCWTASRRDFEFVGRRSGMHLSVQAVPVRDDRAGVIGVMAVCRDVTPRHEVDAALRSSRGLPTGAPARAR